MYQEIANMPENVSNNSPDDPAACSWWDNIWPSAACTMARNAAQIQSVPQNAAAANAAASAAGMPAPYDVPLIQDYANYQTQFVPSDYAAVTTQPSLSDPSTWPWYYWAGILVIIIESGR